VLDRGEQCDDGNLFRNDACPSDLALPEGDRCKYVMPTPLPAPTAFLIRGYTSSPTFDRQACQLEWYVVKSTYNLDRFARLSYAQQCNDGGQGCDVSAFDAQGAPCVTGPDYLCRFQVVACLNNTDPTLTACTPHGVQITNYKGGLDLRVTQVPPARSATEQAIVRDNQGRIASCLLHLHDPQVPNDGYPKRESVAESQVNLCSQPCNIDVLPGRTMNIFVRTRNKQVPARMNYSRLSLSCD
jgi:hypothetical protein